MLEVLKNRSIQQIFLMAIMMRFLLMPFFFHPDIKTYNFQASFLSQGAFNIYSYLEQNKMNLPLKEEFVYFPATYFFLGTYQVIVSPLLGPDFGRWLSDGSSDYLNHPQAFRFLFVMKFPYLILDLLVALTLMAFFKDLDKKKAVLAFWLFNPFSLVLIYVFSNVDIMPVFLSVFSLLMFKEKRVLLAGLLLGLAAGFKAYTLLLIPFLIINVRGRLAKFLVGFVSLGLFGLIVGPFLGTESFRNSTLVSGLTTRLLLLNFSIGFGEMLVFGVIVLSAVFFTNFFREKNNWVYLNSIFVAVLLMVFALIHFHIQWLLWVLPFLCLVVVQKREYLFPVVLILLTAFSIPLLYDDRFMGMALLSPIGLTFAALPTLSSIITRVGNPQVVTGLLHSVLVGGSSVISWRLLANDKKD